MPLPIDRNDNQNHNHNPNHHHASTSKDPSAKLEPVTQSGPNAAVNNRPAQPNTTVNTTWKAKNALQQSNSTTTNIYRPPPPKNQPSNVSTTTPKQQPAPKPETAEPATTSMDVDYMAGEDDMSYFESEDERWMMGDFDIDLDVDLGRPIDFEGEESVANPDDSGFQSADPRKGTPSVPGPTTSASAQLNGTVSGHNNNINNAGLNSSTSGNGNSGQRFGGSNVANATSTGVASLSRPSNGNGNHGNGNKESNFQPLPNVRSGGNGTSNGNGGNRGQPVNSSTGNGNGNNGNGGRSNLSNSTSNVQPSGSGNNRPSAGGFTFPPGVVSGISFLQFLGRQADEPIALTLFCAVTTCVLSSSSRWNKQNASGSPPGSVPLNNTTGHNNNNNQNQNQNQSGIGSKRPAESMLQHPQQQ